MGGIDTQAKEFLRYEAATQSQVSSSKPIFAHVIQSPIKFSDLSRIFGKKNRDIPTPSDIVTISTHALRIIVADDNKSNRTLLSMMLRQHGHMVLEAEDGDSCVKVFDENPGIDLIFMDYLMPTINGFEASKLIRARDKDVVILCLTAQEDEMLSSYTEYGM